MHNSNLIKGVAILLIIIGHTVGVYGNGIRWFTPFGGIGVALFLLISGYGLNESWRHNGSKDWWKKRLLKVWIPYDLIQLAWYWSRHSFSIWPFIGDLTLIRCLHPFGWYLSYLLLWYVAYWGVMKIDVLRNHKFYLWGGIALAVFFVHNEYASEQAFSFLLGVMISDLAGRESVGDNEDKRTGLWKMMNEHSLHTGVVLLLWGIIFLAVKQMPVVRTAEPIIMRFVQLMIKLPCALGIVFLVRQFLYSIDSAIVEKTEDHLEILNGGRNRQNGRHLMVLIQWCGTISYGLYLIHGYLLGVFGYNVVGILLFVIVSITGAWIYTCMISWADRKIREVR